MTFKAAYDYAMCNSEIFRAHDARVKEAQKNGIPSACLIFSVEPNQTFYYGFDGVNIQSGKHRTVRSLYLLNREEVLIIL